MSAIPPTFTFSQSSLQAYTDCPRRFWLAYVEQLPWPAVEASPVQEHEALMRQGEHFHRLVQRVEIGIDPVEVGATLTPPLSTWFAAYRTHRPADLPTQFVEVERVLSVTIALQETGRRHPEPANADSSANLPSRLEAPLAFRLAAKYDLIAAEQDGRTVIVDWKTTSRRSEPAVLRQRWQTIVYPYVLVEASARLPWGPVRPEQVEMRYWFATAPTQPVNFRYDAAQHDANHRRLLHLLAEIAAGETEADFPKVADTLANRRRFCAFCIYRSRCNRGDAAGDLDELDDVEAFFVVDMERALEFTLEDVEELAF